MFRRRAIFYALDSIFHEQIVRSWSEKFQNRKKYDFFLDKFRPNAVADNSGSYWPSVSNF